ncbi:MAG: CheR family methyltransferase [Pirellulaceae bacterium]
MSIELLNPNEFERFRGFIYRESGIRIGDGKISLLSNRIRRRLKACGLSDFGDYFRLLTSSQSSDELQYFLDAVTTNETFFFRTDSHFEWLRSEFLPGVAAQHRRGERGSSLRFWSAACASGAEPWSIAFCLADNQFRLGNWTLNIMGTDISEHEIEKAREAVYPTRMIESLSASHQRRYFATAGENQLAVRPRFRQWVEFATHNLMLPLDQPQFDCIFLCNVLIYFDAASKQTVLGHVTDSLAPGGYLVTGPSEGVFDLLHGYDKVAPMVYRKLPGGEHSDSVDKQQECPR